jgi:Putative zinc-finger
MTCAAIQGLFSPYLDGAVTGRQMRAIAEHLAACPQCDREYTLLVQTQAALASLGRKKAPADLALKLRVAASQEAAIARRPLLAGLSVRLENALNAFMVPATAGAVTAIVIFGLLLGFCAVPEQLQASNDVPLMFYTPPELQESALGLGVGSINADSVIVEAYIDANGRVQDYRILSAPKDSEQLLPELNNALIFTVFRPATALGRPTAGRAVLSFSKINVRG